MLSKTSQYPLFRHWNTLCSPHRVLCTKLNCCFVPPYVSITWFDTLYCLLGSQIQKTDPADLSGQGCRWVDIQHATTSFVLFSFFLSFFLCLFVSFFLFPSYAICLDQIQQKGVCRFWISQSAVAWQVLGWKAELSMFLSRFFFFFWGWRWGRGC